jgi:folate-binding protein YgfZ
MTSAGAVREAGAGAPAHFGDPREELRAALLACALVDRSALARVQGVGADLTDLLQRLSTAALDGLRAGEGKPTVLTTPKGRIIERITVHHLGGDGLLLVGGPDAAERVIGHLDRFTFREETGLSDITGSTRQLALIGPHAGDALRAAGFDLPSPHGVVECELQGLPLRILGEDGLGADGFAVLAQEETAGQVWDRLVRLVEDAGGRAAGALARESHRVLRGIPSSPHELNENHNPLEAGLRSAVSFDKGCYVGQEVIARLNTYDKVSRALVGLEMPAGCAAPESGQELLIDGETLGRVTSAVVPPGWPHAIALAYLKRKSASPTVDLPTGGGTVRARIVDLPFDVSHI